MSACCSNVRGQKLELRDIIDEMVNRRVDANRRFVDELLEKIQDQNHQYFLTRLATSCDRWNCSKKPATSGERRTTSSWQKVYTSILEKHFC